MVRGRPWKRLCAAIDPDISHTISHSARRGDYSKSIIIRSRCKIRISWRQHYPLSLDVRSSLLYPPIHRITWSKRTMTSCLTKPIISCMHLLLLSLPFAYSHPSPVAQAGVSSVIPPGNPTNNTNGLIICNHEPSLPQVRTEDCSPLIGFLIHNLPNVDVKEHFHCAGFQHYLYNDGQKCWIELKTNFMIGEDDFSLGEWLQQGLEVVRYVMHISLKGKITRRRLTILAI